MPNNTKQDTELRNKIAAVNFMKQHDIKNLVLVTIDDLVEIYHELMPYTTAKLDEVGQAIELAKIEARVEAIGIVFELSPKGSFNNWKPIDAFRFYERLKAYEGELQAAKKKLEQQDENT